MNLWQGCATESADVIQALGHYERPGSVRLTLLGHDYRQMSALAS
ncbi:hypothetical protein [Pseudoxanthomonas mexicana]